MLECIKNYAILTPILVTEQFVRIIRCLTKGNLIYSAEKENNNLLRQVMINCASPVVHRGKIVSLFT